MKQKQNDKQLTYKDLAFVFDLKAETLRYRLKNGKTLKESLDTPINSYIRDLTGMVFGRLTPLYPIAGSHRKERVWHCICTCGNECDVIQNNLTSGRQLSCGCLNDERRHEKHKDLSNTEINGVKILYRIEDEVDSNGKHYMMYRCICPFCGDEFEARAANIKTGNTKGCGCTRHQYVHHIDLTDMDFEYCHVNKRIVDQIQPAGGSRVMYECTCFCGKKYTDWAWTIMHGSSNCGCVHVVSRGEEAVKEWLNEHNIKFATRYWFNDLRGVRKMPYYFDFALLDDEYNLLGLIEYQGEQHYYEGEKAEKAFGKTQRDRSDPAKKKYCKEHNIKLFEITYEEDVPTKCEEICDLLYHDNTVPSSN